MKKELEIFTNYLSVERGFSMNTLEAYRNDILDFIKFLEKIQIKKIINVKVLSFSRIFNYRVCSKFISLFKSFSKYNFIIIKRSF